MSGWAIAGLVAAAWIAGGLFFAGLIGWRVRQWQRPRPVTPEEAAAISRRFNDGAIEARARARDRRT